MSKKINKKLLSGFSVEIGLLVFLLLLPLRNIYAGISCPDLDYSSDYTYVYMIIISIIIAYAIVMFILSHIFIKSKILLLKALLLFLILLFFFFLNIIFSAIPAIITTVVLSIILIWTLSYISVKNKILLLKAFITLIAFFVILLIVSDFHYNKEKLKDLNTFIECKKIGGEYKIDTMCGAGHSYCCFIENSSRCCLHADGRKTCNPLSGDYGKKCGNDNDCEGICTIENSTEIEEAWNKYFPENKILVRGNYNYTDINVNDWNNKTAIEIVGKCSKFKDSWHNDTCGHNFEKIQVKDGVIKRNDVCSSGW
jgi:hypothetical protein